MPDRFDLYGALWLFCERYHSGQASRGYRILSRLARVDYQPGRTLRNGRFESREQRAIYRQLVRHHKTTI